MMNSVFKMICSVSRWDSVGGLGRGDNYGPTEWIGGKFVGQYGELSPGKLPICPYGSENHEFCSEYDGLCIENDGLCIENDVFFCFR